MNYSELTTAIQNYCNNTETTFVDTIPTFVKQAEKRIYRKVNLPMTTKTSTRTMTAGTKTLSMPSDFIVPIQMLITSGASQHPVLFRDRSFLRQAYPDASATSRPEFYAILSHDTFELAPTPDSNYSTEVYYYYIPLSIVTNGTSWLGTNADEVLLYGSLIEAYTFMKGDADLLGLYQQRYQDALAALKVQAEGRMTVDEYSDGMIRVPRS
jgi:hypothetical protein